MLWPSGEDQLAKGTRRPSRPRRTAAAAPPPPRRRRRAAAAAPGTYSLGRQK